MAVIHTEIFYIYFVLDEKFEFVLFR